METTVTTTGIETNHENIHELSGMTNFHWIIKNFDTVISSDGEITSDTIHVKDSRNLQCYIQIAKVDGSHCSPHMKSGNYVRIQLLNDQSGSDSEKTVKIKVTIGVVRKKKLYLKNKCKISRFVHYIDESDVKKSLTSSGCLHFNLQIKQLENDRKSTTIDNNFQQYFINDILSDVTFVVDNNNYPAHKIVLASKSPVFERMFSHQMKENITNVVVIDDINSDVFKEMLRFVYTGKIENVRNVCYDLHKVAEKFDISTLRLVCEQQLEHCLTPKNVISILQLADCQNIASLKKKCFEYIKKHFDQTGTMDSYKILKPELWLELLFALNGQRVQTS